MLRSYRSLVCHGLRGCTRYHPSSIISKYSRAFSTKEVPGVTFSESQKSDATFKIDERKRCPSPFEARDASRNAVPFDKSLLNGLTPTLRSFTLESKVAVVTG